MDMRIVVIYDDRRQEKLPLFVGELERQGIKEFEIFPAIVLTHSTVESISASFKAVIQGAKDRGEKEICIMEDDVMIPNEKGWEYFLKNKPESFDIYIGGSYLIDNRYEYKPPVVKVEHYVGNQAIIVSEKYYDKWLATDEKQHCDSAQNNNGDFYVCFPMPILQRSGWSSNHQAIANYNATFSNDELKGFIYQ